MTLIEMLRNLWGNRAPLVAEEYAVIARHNALFMTDMAVFCNAAAPITGATEFDRGVEEGKRRVWLHVARMSGLRPDDFVKTANGELIYDDDRRVR
jgi:hypothetical protein